MRNNVGTFREMLTLSQDCVREKLRFMWSGHESILYGCVKKAHQAFTWSFCLLNLTPCYSMKACKFI